MASKAILNKATYNIFLTANSTYFILHLYLQFRQGVQYDDIYLCIDKLEYIVMIKTNLFSIKASIIRLHSL